MGKKSSITKGSIIPYSPIIIWEIYLTYFLFVSLYG